MDHHKRKKKESKDQKVIEILALRDDLKKDAAIAEAADMACKGMYKCSKLADDACLARIKKDLLALKNEKPAKKKGGRARSRSRSRSKSKTRK
jgi:hypothetical protein